MLYIVLAAGRGTRLRPLTEGRPKPLATIDGDTSLIDVHVRNALDSDSIREILVVTGYESELLDSRIAQYPNTVSCVYNPFFRVSGPLGSLWTAMSGVRGQDFAVVNGDTLFHRELFDRLDRPKPSISLLVSAKDVKDPDDMCLLLGNGERSIETGKDIPGAEFVSAGFAIVRGARSRDCFVSALDELVRDEHALTDGHWHEVFDRLSSMGVDVDLEVVPPDWWIEVDTPADLSQARAAFSTTWIDAWSE